MQIWGVADKLFGKLNSTKMRLTLDVFSALVKENFNYTVRNAEEYEIAQRFLLYPSPQWEPLLAGLDQESKRVACAVYDRYLHIARNNLINRNLFTIKEREFQKADRVPPQYHGIWKYPFPLEESVFVFHNGLTYVPQKNIAAKKGTIAIDGGGYYADSAYIFSQLYPFGHVYSYEPNAQVAAKAWEHIQELQLANVTISSRPLGGAAPLSMDKTVGLIKLDIEGAEFAAIKSMKKIIKRDKPILLIALYHRPEDFFLIKPFIEKLAPKKYTFKIRKLNPNHLVFETYLIGYPKK
ncbi:hypothetical protein COU89_02630 [Candidatus Roizmanbacteria bacterium CG10_big_fil_rev_8_21_14_0_10_45_7]|uniref:Methyltransferase FkbM domain-containing protein n=1 Tax=Candidatus Roizmanbacteria bacterium CG10_big_fil_rev_8_21_14_0_10_45_7 TaxID=1974854 RepID=A0A2M8KUG0_9BACT|nr:MAG: hypothetical protein COU89_02630 [Candidatus Roizmanbacteria bacterium CG10_big_fil_rev_8_21_14_0_10_45_7]